LQVVKFGSPGEHLTQISAEDKTIASLKTIITDLNVQITALDARINTLSEKSQNAVKAKNRITALAALKSKKAAETTLAQRYDTLSQLEGIYGKIEQASDQVAVIRVMEASTGVLQSLHARVGGVERVEDVIEGLRIQMSKVDEIGQVMEDAGCGEAVFDDDAVDEELKALEQQDRLEREERGAEQTRQRLAELDAAKKQSSITDGSAEKPEQREDPKVADGLKPLRRLSLEEKQPQEVVEKAFKEAAS